MSVSAISSAGSDQLWQAQAAQNRFQKVHGELETLGQDLRAGNLTQAQTDLAKLTQDLTGSQANSTVQRDLQKHAAGVGSHRHHHHAGGQQGTDTTGSSNDPIMQMISALGQATQSGDLSAAQQDFATLLQQLAAARNPYVTNAGGVAPAATIGTTVNATA